MSVFCLPLTAAAPLVGIRALRDIRTRPDRTGRGTTWTGIALGLLFTLGWAVLLYNWHLRARRPMLEGPVAELRAGLAGDVAGFREGFVDGPEADAQAFLSAVGGRFGELRSISQRSGGAAADASMPELVIPYTMEFDRATVEADAAFLIYETPRRLVLRWAWLAIRDPVEGDLVYPSSMLDAAEAAREPPDLPPPPEGP